ncbi:FMN-binding negative transcriptional regulator [Tengunoibacter tsumagoiensis]|uniref:Transcriptional regulator n=1 Tax=Tengunoibacter tsumagoiensis TaxID=2014871 RepID=A0A402A8M0_9CHLR|nr:FMN-binding negative transcriptional regulator [Tengunoibacter tsumagoiensis]GCE15335.1 transcriptional regulator [Tengunoibacter tsumagoiensis]
MYIPGHFNEANVQIIHAFMRDYSFATLVSTDENGVPIATPLPFLLESEPAPYGTLKAHMALGNPQWKSFRADQEVLVMFQGPHAYITPSWYEQPLSVPTWNYAAVHAYGLPLLITETEASYQDLKNLIDLHERQFEHPWSLEQVPDEYIQKMMKGTVSFSIEITRLQGKFKMSQNRTPTERERISEELEKSPDATRVAASKLVKG